MRHLIFFALLGLAGPLHAQDPTICRYELQVPADLDLSTTPPFDTTIVRSPGCMEHLLHFPGWGTSTSYRIIFEDLQPKDQPSYWGELNFHAGEPGRQWLDITGLPVGSYSVWLFACGNGGTFTLRIE